MKSNPFLIFIAALGAAGALSSADMGLPGLPGDSGGYSYQPSADEMAKLQARIDDLLAQAKATRESADRLDNMVDRLLNSTGVRFGGQAVAHSISLATFPTSGGNSSEPYVRRAWPTVGYLDFKIMAKPKPELSGEVVYRMEKVFGGYWGSLDISGVRRFNMHGDTAIGFDLGHFNYRRSPLTVWAQEDEYPFEIEILARKRKAGMEQVYLGENKWPLQGGRLDATLVLFDSVDLALEGIGVRTAIAGTKNTGLPFAVVFPYDQYLVGGSIDLMGKDSKAFRLGASYFEFIESKDTSITPPIAPQLRSNVVGADIEVQLLGREVVLKAEGANANYTFDYGRPVSWTTGGAGDLQVLLKGESHDVKLHGIYVDEKFINYASQTRTHPSTYDVFGEVPTGNNLLDPREGDYGLASVTNLYFTRFNPAIFATNQGRITTLGGTPMQEGGIYLPPGYRNTTLPYGWATPNRAGGGVDGSLSFMDGAFKPRGFYGMYFEPTRSFYVPRVVGSRTYGRMGGGATLDFAPVLGLPLAISGGWEAEDAKATSVVSYAVQTGSFGLNWQAFKGVYFVGGWQQTAAYGMDYTFAFHGATTSYLRTINHISTTTAGGVYWDLSKSTDFQLTYAHTDWWSPGSSSGAGMEEFESKLVMRF